MKVKLLAQITYDGVEYHVTSKAEPRLVILDKDKEKGIDRLTEYFGKHLEKTLGKWIQFWKNQGTEHLCNCPQGYIELPIDLWKCKIDNSICNLQAQVDITDRDTFFSKCAAGEEQKNGIFSAITEGKYDGFHHVPGRNLCVMCEANPKTKGSYQYHYEIEMQFIEEIVGNSEDEIQRIVARSSYPSNIKYCAICTDCALKVINDLFAVNSPELRKIEIDYHVR